MKTKFILTSMLVSLFISMVQAQIPNADFELWTDFGSWEDPDGWYTLNSIYNGNPETVRSTTVAFTAPYAVRMENKEDDDGNVVRGMMVSGSQSLSDNPGFPYANRPNSLDGYWQYNPQDNNDSCYVLVYLTLYNFSTQSREVIGSGWFSSGDDMDNYSFFSAPLNYVSPEYPDSAYIVIYSGKFNGALDGSRLFIDALSFNETATGTRPPNDEQDIKVFPNPAKGYFNIHNLNEASSAVVSLYDFTGTLKKDKVIKMNNATINVSDLNGGIYLYEITTKNKEVLKTGKILVQ